jgi:hypothetical protein
MDGRDKPDHDNLGDILMGCENGTRLVTKARAEIIESVAALFGAERRALVEHLVATNLGAPSFYERMTPEERAHLDEGIAQADRGEGRPAEDVYAELAQRLGLRAG